MASINLVSSMLNPYAAKPQVRALRLGDAVQEAEVAEHKSKLDQNLASYRKKILSAEQTSFDLHCADLWRELASLETYLKTSDTKTWPKPLAKAYNTAMKQNYPHLPLDKSRFNSAMFSERLNKTYIDTLPNQTDGTTVSKFFLATNVQSLCSSLVAASKKSKLA